MASENQRNNRCKLGGLSCLGGCGSSKNPRETAHQTWKMSKKPQGREVRKSFSWVLKWQYMCWLLIQNDFEETSAVDLSLKIPQDANHACVCGYSPASRTYSTHFSSLTTTEDIKKHLQGQAFINQTSPPLQWVVLVGQVQPPYSSAPRRSRHPQRQTWKRNHHLEIFAIQSEGEYCRHTWLLLGNSQITWLLTPCKCGGVLRVL